MKRESRKVLSLALVAVLFGAGLWVWGKDLPVFSQASGPGPTNFGSKDSEMPSDPREAYGGQMLDFPTWPVSKEMPNDVFTFARLRYTSGMWQRRHPKWLIDYPDADLNFSYRLQQLTSMEVNPKGAIVDIDEEQLRHYPFVYMIEPGNIYLTDDEARILREYLLNGGFIMVDDFWGTDEWDVFYQGLKQIFPNKEPVELICTIMP